MHWLLQIWVEVCANPTQSQCIHTSRVLLENTGNSLLRRQLMPSLRLDSRLCCCLVSQSCLTLLWPFCSPPGSSVYGILQARILEWVAISFSKGSSWPRDWTHITGLSGGFLPLSRLGSPYARLYWWTFKLFLIFLLENHCPSKHACMFTILHLRSDLTGVNSY